MLSKLYFTNIAENIGDSAINSNIVMDTCKNIYDLETVSAPK